MARNKYTTVRSALYLWLGVMVLAVSVCAEQDPGASAAGNTGQDPAAMVVGGRTVSVSELCAAIATLPPPQAEGYALHPTLATQWYGPIVALAAEAKREHLDGSLAAGEVHGDAEEVDREEGLAEALIQELARDIQPNESEIVSYYAAHQSEFERTKARYILISDANAFGSRSKRTPAEAKVKAEEIFAQLKQGARFAALAIAESDDPYTKDKGGELGEVSHRQMEPAVDRAIWSLAPGETSAPFEGRFGYEIVQVEARRTLPLVEVRQSVIGDIKVEGSERRQQEIIAASHIALTKIYTASPLSCAPGPVTPPKSVHQR